MLWFENDTPGTAIGYSAALRMENMDGIHVIFAIKCPEKYAGGILHIDLYNGDAGYDNGEQEYTVTLQAGKDEVSLSLPPGEVHPQMAWLRIFTLDSAQYKISDLHIYQENALPSVSTEMIAGASACFLVLGVTIAV